MKLSKKIRSKDVALPTSFHTRGFTIIEVVTVMAIMATILGITLSVDRSSQTAIKQLNATYEVALFIREAQVMGTSVVNEGSSFDHAIGIFFDDSAQTDIIMFSDSDDDNEYGAGDTIIETMELQDNTSVTACAGPFANPSASCGDTNIVFKRPHPDALIYDDGGSERNAAQVTVSASGISRNILVYNTGLISVE